MDWNRIHLDDVPWQPVEGYPGVSMRFLGEDQERGPWLMHIRFAPGYVEPAHWHNVDTVYVITAGELSVGSEGVYAPGDVRWVRSGTFYGPESAGPAGCEFLLMGSGGPPGLDYERASAGTLGALGEGES